MDPDELESRLKSLPLRQPSGEFGKPETLNSLDDSTEVHTLVERIRDMPWKFKTIGGLGIAASLAALYLAFAGISGGTVAFAQVIEKLNAARSLSFDVEVRSVGSGKVINQSHNYYLVPGKHRSEDRTERGDFAVFDADAGKILMVDSTRRIARISSFKSAGRDMASETIESIRALQATDADVVGEKEIDGNRARGHEFSRGENVTTVWTSQATGELLQIDILHKNVPSGPVSTTWTNIEIDGQLDPSLFSLDPPEGYEVVPFIDIDMNSSPANFIAQLLKYYADHHEDKFPTDLQGGFQELMERLAPKEGREPPEDIDRISFVGAAAAAVVRSAKRGEAWEYYPDVEFGQADEIVFWFFDKRKQQHSAVFGDLRVENIAKDRLPRD